MFLRKIGQNLASKRETKEGDPEDQHERSTIALFLKRLSFESLFDFFDWADEKDRELSEM